MELKLLPSHLKYKFLGPGRIFPVIISTQLNGTQIEKLLCVLQNIEALLDIVLMISRGLALHLVCLEFFLMMGIDPLDDPNVV